MPERGQATIEYLGVVALVTALLALAGTALLAPGVANAVLGGLRHALCVVTGGACGAERAAACVVAESGVRDRLAGTLALVRAGRDHAVLRRRLSDGSVQIVVMEDWEGGVQATLGPRVRAGTGAAARDGQAGEAEDGGRGIRVGASLQGALLARAGGGRVYRARDDRDADRLVDAIGEDGQLRWITAPVRFVGEQLGLREAPGPEETYVQLGAGAAGEAGLSFTELKGVLGVAAGAVVGRRTHHRTGERTYYLSQERSAGGELGAVVAELAGGGAALGTVGVTVDRADRPVRLSVAGVAAARLGGAEGRRIEYEATLDLTRPASAAAFRDLVRPLGTPGPGRAAALRRLVDRVRADARLDRRVYATSQRSRGAAAGAGLGLKLDGEVLRTRDAARLLDAATRPAGGVWERRGDCLSAT